MTNRKMRSKLANQAAKAARERSPRKRPSDEDCSSCGEPLSDHLVLEVTLERIPPKEQLH